jgi:hypothetical protein
MDNFKSCAVKITDCSVGSILLRCVQTLLASALPVMLPPVIEHLIIVQPSYSPVSKLSIYIAIFSAKFYIFFIGH